MAVLIKNLLFAVLAASATLCLLVLTLFTALMGPWIPTAVALTYAVSIGFVWRSRVSAPPSSAPFEETRRWATRAFVISALGFVIAFAGNILDAIRPSQAKLAGRFHEHRSEYEALREMILADGPNSVSECGRSMARDIFRDHTPEDLGIARERQASYERLLRLAGCPNVGFERAPAQTGG